MALSYDFDMFSIMPKELQAQFGEFFDKIGATEMAKEQMALFRDPAAVEALRGASEEIGECFKASGFGLNVYDSGAGPGRFPASDGPARAAVIEKLMVNLESLPDGLDWNGFDIEAFAMAALNAKPLDTKAQSFSDMRGQSAAPPAAPATGGMDQFFANSTPPAPERQTGGNMDDFFSSAPRDARAAAPAPAAAPDMDSFFSNTSGAAARAVQSRPMTAEDIRMTIDTPAPKRGASGMIKMVIAFVGLYFAVSILAGEGGTDKLIEIATGVQSDMMSR